MRQVSADFDRMALILDSGFYDSTVHNRLKAPKLLLHHTTLTSEDDPSRLVDRLCVERLVYEVGREECCSVVVYMVHGQ